MEWHEIILIVVAFCTSTISGVLGMGGGIVLLAIVASFFPPLTAIPIHGVAQLGSNVSRTVLSYRFADWIIIAAFGIGTVLGSMLAYNVFTHINLPKVTFQIILGVFILIMTWMPKLKSVPYMPGKGFRFGLLGTTASFLGVFIGATGPLIAPFYLRENLNKERLVATKAGCQVFVHTGKIIVFGLTGFVFADYIPLLIGLLVAVTLGSWAGKILLGKLNERLFRTLFQLLVTAAALKLLIEALILN